LCKTISEWIILQFRRFRYKIQSLRLIFILIVEMLVHLSIGNTRRELEGVRW
jgi:hypothetical protein